MAAFARGPKVTEPTSAKPMTAARAPLGGPIQDLQRRIGNQALQRMLQAHGGNAGVDAARDITRAKRDTVLRQTQHDDPAATVEKAAARDAIPVAVPDTGEQQKTEEKTEEKKSLVLSRGVLQMTSEGDFTEGQTSVKRPHFPFNVNIFEALSADEIKSYDDAKSQYDKDKKANPKLGKFEEPYTRYSGPDGNGVFKANPAGGYKMGAEKARHATATYTATLAVGQQLGTTNSSGVTISFGVDFGARYSSQAAAKKELIAAGILDDKGAGVGGNKADKLLDAVGLKGLKAAEKAAALRSEGIELTATQALSLMNVVIPSYDKSDVKGYARGDGTLHPAVEEVVTALSYWGGNVRVRKAIVDEAKGKEGAAQFSAAANAIKANKTSEDWMQRGYQIMISYCEILAEMADAGYEITMSGAVSDPDTLTGAKTDAKDNTLQFVNDLHERVDHASKDLKKQISGTALSPLIAAPVGEGKTAKNNEADVTAIQQLLYNGNYDVEVTGKYDDKTKAAIEKFTKAEFKAASTIVRPGGETVRRLKEFQYLKRKT